jgi:hypothetical protein
MGHMNITENLAKVRRGCKGVWPARGSEGHSTYSNDCQYCFYCNGGGTD